MAIRDTGSMIRKLLYVAFRWSYFLCDCAANMEKLTFTDGLNEERFYHCVDAFRKTFNGFKTGFNVNTTLDDLMTYCDNEGEREFRSLVPSTSRIKLLQQAGHIFG